MIMMVRSSNSCSSYPPPLSYDGISLLQTRQDSRTTEQSAAVPLRRFLFLLLVTTLLSSSYIQTTSTTRFVVHALAPPLFFSPPPPRVASSFNSSSSWSFDSYKASLSAFRAQRNNISFLAYYQTQHLPAEHCRFLSEAACRRDDQAHVEKKRIYKQQQQQASRRRRRQLRQRQLNPPTMGGGGRGGGENGSEQKIFRVLVILCQFQDHAANPNWQQQLPSREYFETLFNGGNNNSSTTSGTPVDDDTSRSIAEYLRFNSMNAYRVEFNVVSSWQTTNNTEAYFSQGQAGRVGLDELQHIFTPILDQMDRDGFDWTLYDQAGGSSGGSDGSNDGSDGILDHLVVIHSGAGAEFGDALGPCSTNNDGASSSSIVFAPYLDRIWSQGAGTVANPWTSSRPETGGIQLGGFTIAGAFGTPLCDMVRYMYAIPPAS
jgi:Immune inhibitor A peptidase M6